MTKVNPENMKELYDELWNTFCEKNHDYGNSFERSLDKHGLVAGVIRMEDKMNRISTLVDGHKQAEVASESLVDTLMDLSNYAAMSACWLEGKYAGDYTRSHWKPSPLEPPTYEEDLETVKNLLHLSSFEGHQEKVNERAYYDRDDVSDEEIIKNWGLVGDSANDTHTIRSRTTGQYFTEDDNPELFKKIYGVLRADSYKKYNRKIYGVRAVDSYKKYNRQMELTSKIVREVNTGRDNIEADMESDTEVICRTVRDSKNEPLLTDPKGLENGYFIRQHTNPENNSRYTLAFNPEGTVKTRFGEDLPYVIECYGNNYDGMTGWAIHVFNTREDMVTALNYDSKKHLTGVESKNLGDTIGDLNITKYVFSPENTTQVFAAWMDTFGEPFIKNMTSRNIFSDGHIGVEQGIKIFSMVFISEKTGALVVKGLIRNRCYERRHNFIWFSDTKEVILEVLNAAPKFNSHGIFYDIDEEYLNTGENIYFNPLYNNMEDKILSKFHTWDGSELKNLVFFNEDEPLNS